MPSSVQLRLIRFGVFEADLQAQELRKQGMKVKLQDQPFQLLVMLLERPGELVTRDEVRQKLWPGDTFVDFDHGLNNAVNRLREALGDSAETPRFIETLPRKGYRFVAPVEVVSNPAADSLAGLAFPSPTEPQQVAQLQLGSTQPATEKLSSESGLRKAWLPVSAVIVLLTALFAFNVGRMRNRLLSTRGPVIHSLVVLPLENLSGDPSQEYFADGITDALITNLARIGSLRVISRTSAMHYKGSHMTLPEIARELNVDAAVEGTVVRSGDRVHITAQLVLARSDRHLWADSYDRELRDVLILQSEVSRNIVQQVRVTLTPQEQAAQVSRLGQVSPQAHDLYLKGLYQWFRQTPEGYQKSREYFQQAIDTDPTYALGYSGLGYYYSISADEGLMLPKEGWEKTRAADRKALELDPSLAEPHLGLAAATLLYDWNWPEARKEFEVVLQLNPGWAENHREYAIYWRTIGQLDEAIAEARRAQDLDPLSVSISASLGWNYYYARRYDEAIQQFRKTSEMDSYSRLGYGGTMRALYRFWLDEYNQEARIGYVSPFIFATLYAQLDDKHQAFLWLEKAYQERSSKLLDINLDPDFDSLRSDRPFQDLVRRIGLPG